MTVRVRGGVFGEFDCNAPTVATRAPGPFGEALAGRGRYLATSHARGGLDHLVERLNPRRVWLPAYLCGALLTRHVRSRAWFYGVGGHLEIGSDVVDGMDISSGDLFVAIAYFGGIPNADALRSAQVRGARVLVDASGALLTEGLERSADYLLASPRKFVGVPDGGLLVPVGNAPWFDTPTLDAWDDAPLAVHATRGRAAFDLLGGNGPDRAWFTAFSAAERAAPSSARAMLPQTMTALGRMDWLAVARRRRANFLVLAEGLRYRTDLNLQLLRTSLDDGEVPLGAVVVFEDAQARDAARAALHAAGIYAPVHWTLDGVTPAHFERERDLAARCLTLVCDQRCDELDMFETIDILSASASCERST